MNNDDRRLVIRPQKYSGETTVTSIRMPKSMLADIDKVAAATGRSRNDIMLISLEFALQHMEVEEKEE